MLRIDCLEWNDRADRIFEIVDEVVEFLAFHRRIRRLNVKLSRRS